MKNESKNEILSISIDDEFENLSNTLGAEYTTTFNNHIANKTSINEAIFISWFLYMWREKSKDGEMFLVEEAFHKRTSIPKTAFRKIVKKWEQLEIVKTSFKGVPMKKHYCLNKSRFVHYIKSLQSGKPNPSKSEGLTLRKVKGYITLKSLTESSDEDSKKQPSCGRQNAATQECVFNDPSSPTLFNPNPPKKKSFSAIMSKKLWSKVSSKNQLPCNSKNRSSWTATFTKMMKEDDGRTKQRVRRVLLWYIDHYGEDHVPEARCANTFRKKFCEIEAAMNRWLKQNGQDTKDSDSPTITRRVINTRIMD
jgi:hypothetical protein